MHPRVLRTHIGDLDTRVVASPGAPTLAVALCHGFGAPGDDLVPLAFELERAMGESRNLSVRYYFPEAPDSAAIGFGRAWWQLDEERLARIARGERTRGGSHHDEVPDGLAPSRRRLTHFLEEVSRQCGLPTSRVVVGGFSQGAMLATDVSLRLEEAPAALVVLSGTLICAAPWSSRMAARRGLRVFMSHGRDDPLLPFDDATVLRDRMIGAGLEVEFRGFEGGHEIPGAVVLALAEFISRAG
jgi:phospholipase/carboxylesterase